jgi:hypothetical protein
MRTHADGGKIFKTTSGTSLFVVPSYGMALACPSPIAHIEDHCQEVGTTPGMPMSTPFILRSSSRDLELKRISTARIPDYAGNNDSGSTAGVDSSTESGHGGKGSVRSTSPSGDGTARRDGDENAGDEAPRGLGGASAGSGTKSSHIDFGGGSAAAKKAKKGSSERRRSRKGRKPSRTGAGDGKPLFGELTHGPWLRLRKSSKMEAPSLRQRLMSLWSSLR